MKQQRGIEDYITRS